MHNTCGSVLIVCLLIVFGCANKEQPATVSPSEDLLMNKDLVQTFYREAIGQLNEAIADSILKDDYIQHNPMVKTGKAGFFETLAFLKQMPRPENPKSPIVRIIAEGDLVALHLSVNVMGAQKAVIDIFRVEDGKLAEHWDAMQDESENSKNGRLMTTGETEIGDLNLTDANKKLVSDFYNEVWLSGKVEGLSQYVDSELIQHDPEVGDGMLGLVGYLKASPVVVTKVHRLVAEGNFVVAQLEGEIAGEPAAIYDIQRLVAGKIVEQWRVKQVIPEVMMHDNGMF